jgi:hypothetical protein
MSKGVFESEQNGAARDLVTTSDFRNEAVRVQWGDRTRGTGLVLTILNELSQTPPIEQTELFSECSTTIAQQRAIASLLWFVSLVFDHSSTNIVLHVEFLPMFALPQNTKTNPPKKHESNLLRAQIPEATLKFCSVHRTQTNQSHDSKR